MNPRIGGIAAALGGLFWMVKAAAILITGDQPPVLFESASILFALGILGLRGRLRDPQSRLAFAGMVFACVAAVAGVGAVITTEFGIEVASEEDFSPFIFVSFLTTLVALALVAVPAWRERALQPHWHLVPIALAWSFIPLIAVGGMLEPINERLLEVPILILGLGWVLVGYATASKRV